MFGKMNPIEQKIFEIIISNIETQELDNLSYNSDLIDIGFDSIKFIETIVALEIEFDFEFDDERLLISKSPTIKSMIEYVKFMVVGTEP